MGTGTLGILVAIIAIVPGTLALLATRRKDTSDVFVRRDADSWTRMLDSVARSDKDRVSADQRVDDMDKALAEAQAHTRRCDKALAEAQDRIEQLATEVAALRHRIDGVTP